MVKKEKVQLTPEELAAKKLKSRKNWARVGAVALALVLTFALFKFASKGGPQEIEQKVAVQGNNGSNQSGQSPKKDETTTAKSSDTATTKASSDTATTTKKASTDSSSSSGLAGIGDKITGFFGGLGDIGGGGSLPTLPKPDGGKAGDAAEKVGDSFKDFMYGLAEKAEQNTTKPATTESTTEPTTESTTESTTAR